MQPAHHHATEAHASSVRWLLPSLRVVSLVLLLLLIFGIAQAVTYKRHQLAWELPVPEVTTVVEIPIAPSLLLPDNDARAEQPASEPDMRLSQESPVEGAEPSITVPTDNFSPEMSAADSPSGTAQHVAPLSSSDPTSRPGPSAAGPQMTPPGAAQPVTTATSPRGLEPAAAPSSAPPARNAERPANAEPQPASPPPSAEAMPPDQKPASTAAPVQAAGDRTPPDSGLAPTVSDSSLQQSPAFPPTLAGGTAAYSAGAYQQAHDIWRDLAEAGNVRAQFHLGALYFEGRTGPADPLQAFLWLSRAANGGYRAAEALRDRAWERMTPQQRVAARTRVSPAPR